jgi:hypothetical protein
MTTAHRPTWNTAKGKIDSSLILPTRAYSSKDLQSHGNLKKR